MDNLLIKQFTDEALGNIVQIIVNLRRLSKHVLPDDQVVSASDAFRQLLNRGTKLELRFRTEFVPLGHLAQYLGATAIESITNAQLREAVHYFVLSQLFELVGNDETKRHHIRTAEYAHRFAEILGMDKRQSDEVRYASYLHDIGMIGIPEPLLARRWAEERNNAKIVFAHTWIGAYIVNSTIEALGVSRGPLFVARDLAYHHHDHYDGSGCRPIAGSAIPLPARIFLIVDVYDNLRREFPHRGAMLHYQAINEMRSMNHREQPFDPELFPVFLDMQEEIISIHNSIRRVPERMRWLYPQFSDRGIRSSRL